MDLFAIIEFDEEGGVSYIPIKWLYENNTKCYWPDESSKLNSYRNKMHSPAKEWISFGVKRAFDYASKLILVIFLKELFFNVIKNCLLLETAKEARKKEKISVFTSNLESSTDEEDDYPLRNKNNQTIVSNTAKAQPSSSSNFNADKMKTKNKTSSRSFDENSKFNEKAIDTKLKNKTDISSDESDDCPVIKKKKSESNLNQPKTVISSNTNQGNYKTSALKFSEKQNLIDKSLVGPVKNIKKTPAVLEKPDLKRKLVTPLTYRDQNKKKVEVNESTKFRTTDATEREVTLTEKRHKINSQQYVSLSSANLNEHLLNLERQNEILLQKVDNIENGLKKSLSSILTEVRALNKFNKHAIDNDPLGQFPLNSIKEFSVLENSFKNQDTFINMVNKNQVGASFALNL